MRRPDATAGGGAGKHQLRAARAALRGARTMKQAYSDEAREQADKACQNHEPPVVLTREA